MKIGFQLALVSSLIESETKQNGDIAEVLKNVAQDTSELGFDLTAINLIKDTMVYISWGLLAKSVIQYRYKWLNNKLFDNHKVGLSLAAIDKEKFYRDDQSCFPIQPNTVKTFNLIDPNRWFKLTSAERSMVTNKLIRTIFQVGMCYVMIILDHATFSTSKHVRKELSFHIQNIKSEFKNEKNVVQLSVEGKGIYGEALTKLSKSLNKLKSVEEAQFLEDFMDCMPKQYAIDTESETMIHCLCAIIKNFFKKKICCKWGSNPRGHLSIGT